MQSRRLPVLKIAAITMVALTCAATPALARQDTAPQAAQPPSPETVLANLSSIQPLNLVYVVSGEWAAGNKLKAAFWFYVWQIRTDAWVTGMNDSGFTQSRNMLNNQMGQGVNTWIAADPALMRDTAERAISYEAKLPLWTERPEGLGESDWAAIIAKSRADYASEMQAAFAEMPVEEIRTLRQEKGLPVGTPADMGEPLPDDWR